MHRMQDMKPSIRMPSFTNGASDNRLRLSEIEYEK